jgi:hypothetical protein
VHDAGMFEDALHQPCRTKLRPGRNANATKPQALHDAGGFRGAGCRRVAPETAFAGLRRGDERGRHRAVSFQPGLHVSDDEVTIVKADATGLTLAAVLRPESVSDS